MGDQKGKRSATKGTLNPLCPCREIANIGDSEMVSTFSASTASQCFFRPVPWLLCCGLMRRTERNPNKISSQLFGRVFRFWGKKVLLLPLKP